MRHSLSFLLLVLIWATSLAAQAPPPPCQGEEYRQFDFWAGDWNVVDGAGTPQGTNRIESILGGCSLQENWVGTSGSIGHSYNAYDRASGHWYQTWVDNSGLILRLQGGLEGSAMVMSGPGRARDGSDLVHRITWTPLDDGRVRQHWQSSGDKGATWADVFVGYYVRKPAG